MINAKELRIGNLILLGKMKEPHSVFHIWFERETGFVIDNCPEKDAHPIPLSEEWLLRAGFVEKKHFFYKPDFVLGYLTTDDNLQLEHRVAGTESWKLLDIKHVHQLQNLYWCLVGKELEIIL